MQTDTNTGIAYSTAMRAVAKRRALSRELRRAWACNDVEAVHQLAARLHHLTQWMECPSESTEDIDVLTVPRRESRKVA